MKKINIKKLSFFYYKEYRKEISTDGPRNSRTFYLQFRLHQNLVQFEEHYSTYLRLFDKITVKLGYNDHGYN